MTQWFIKDNGNNQMAPLCDLRATFEQRTGGLTTLERMTNLMGCSPTGFLCDDEVRSAMIAERTGLDHVTDEIESTTEHPAINSPWDILNQLPSLLAQDLEHATPLGGEYGANSFGNHRIDVHDSAIIFPGVVLDASEGAIRIEEGASIRSNAVLCGPCWIGKNSNVMEHALIKPNTSIGPWCKIGGEVGSTIFQGYSNKCHAGHLGDSVIGEWVNFGADTTNSNLLNTYSDVIVTDLMGKRHKTDRKFIGCFVGDYVKFSICTRIMTGSFIGTGAMIASTTPAPSPTKRFAWHTDEGERTYQIDKFLKVANTVMNRRDVKLHKTTELVLRSLANE